MFRRPGKNPLEEGGSLYGEENPHVSPYKYNVSSKEELPSRLFETPPQGRPRPLPVEEEALGWNKGEKAATVPHHFVEEAQPETTLGEGVTFRGELSFERLLRIDGAFEGTLLSQGKVIVGPKGKVKANLNLREAVIEGEVEGNITVQERLDLRGEACVKGDIRAKSLCVDEGVILSGHVHVMPEERDSPSF